MIKRVLIRAIRITAATVQAIAWLLMASVMLTLLLVAFACILLRLLFNAPMIVWRAASGATPPSQ